MPFPLELSDAGIPKTYIGELVKEGALEYLERGIYVAKDSFDDDMYRLQAKYSLKLMAELMAAEQAIKNGEEWVTEEKLKESLGV